VLPDCRIWVKLAIVGRGLGVEDAGFQEELQRVLASETLRNSESLRRLLAYLGDAYVSGTGRDLKEYTIGRDVMHKPADYDPRMDASVRVQIGKLRQRLEQYYTLEAPEACIRVTLPKGHFELGTMPGKAAASAVPTTLPAPPAAASRSWKWATLAASSVAGILAVALAISILRAPAAPAAADLAPGLQEFWAPLTDTSRPLVLVLGSPLFVRLNSHYFRNPWANNWEEAEREIPLAELSRLLQAPVPPSASYRWTPFGEAAAAFRLAMVLGRRKDLVLKRSIVLPWEDVRISNLVFLGPVKFNRQLADLPVEEELRVENGGVTNVHPQAGEAAVYRKPSPPHAENIPEDYAVITRVRRVHGWGETLVLASTSTEGTWAAADYVTSSSMMQEMLGRLKSANGGKVPDHYQVLLRSRFNSQVPIHTEYVTHRILRPRISSR
jgi:hypothetical protein